MLCIHHHHPPLEIFRYPILKLYLLNTSSVFPFLPATVTTILLSVSTNLTTLGTSCNICPLASDLFHLAYCLHSSSMHQDFIPLYSWKICHCMSLQFSQHYFKKEKKIRTRKKKGKWKENTLPFGSYWHCLNITLRIYLWIDRKVGRQKKTLENGVWVLLSKTNLKLSRTIGTGRLLGLDRDLATPRIHPSADLLQGRGTPAANQLIVGHTDS